MSIATERKALINQFNEVQDLALIRTIKSMLTSQRQAKTKNEAKIKQVLSYAPETIEINGTKYTLNYPLRCLFEKEDDHFIIKNELLDIYAVGDDEEEAKKDFCEEFDYLYRTLNSLDNDKMTSRLQKIKLFINHYVKKQK